jgi:hypothetical protein
MGHATKSTRQNRTITVGFHDETTYFALLDNPKGLLSLSSPLPSRLAFSSTTNRLVPAMVA